MKALKKLITRLAVLEKSDREHRADLESERTSRRRLQTEKNAATKEAKSIQVKVVRYNHLGL